MQNISSAAFTDSKPHYDLLDGLRGVAALLVVWYHVFEGYAFAGGTTIDTINHGYRRWISSLSCPVSLSAMPMTTAGRRR